MISNQGVVTADGIVPVLTDYPNLPGTEDGTTVTVKGESPYIEAYKSVSDYNGGTVNPGIFWNIL